MNATPSTKPSRRKGFATSVAVLAIAATVAGSLLWLANRPAFEWWVSPPIGNSGRHARILVPRGWQAQIPLDAGREVNGERAASFGIYLLDRRPNLLRMLFWQGNERSGMTINTIQ